MLKAWGIQALAPYSAANLDAARPDLVIIGGETVVRDGARVTA